MAIETKFNVGDEVWYLCNNKVCCRKISSIVFRVSEFGASTTYYVPTPSESIALDEKLVFSSKEELIKSL